MTAALLGLVLPVVAVWSAFRAAGLGMATHSQLLTLALATCVAIGTSSAITFLTLTLGGSLDGSFIARDVAIWGLLLIASLWTARRRRHALPRAAAFPVPTPADWLLRGAFLLVVAMAFAVPLVEYGAAPHGQWDAWAIWNQKARFMFRAGPDWVESMAIRWSQPGHPPLVSGSVARLWAYAGEELTAVPAMLSLVFAAATLGVVMGALNVRRRSAWVGGAVLVAPLTFSHLAAAQTADLPLGLFIMASLAMLPKRPSHWREGGETQRALWLAGATASLAAWTKNEGMVFLGVTTALVVWSTWRHGRMRDVSWWVGGAAPFFVALLWFKLRLVPQGPDYLQGAMTLSTALARVLDANRVAVLSETVWEYAVAWGGAGATGSLLAVIGIAFARAVHHAGHFARGVLAVAGVMAGSYCAVYLLTPLDVRWLVQTTFDRLTLQVWPAIVFAACAPMGELEGPSA